MRWFLVGVMFAVVGCHGEQVYVVDRVYEDECGTALGEQSELVLGVVEDDVGGETYTLEVPELDLAVACEVYEGRPDQVCICETEEGALERWFWGREGEVLAVAVERTEPDGSFCMSTLSARPWGSIEIEDEDLEQAALALGFIVAPPEVQLGAAVVVGILLDSLSGGLGVIGDAGS
jgi:hypothetical protein